MSKDKIKIIKGDITTYKKDAIVNAANMHLYPGGGVCGAIFEKAGFDELYTACKKCGPQEVGSATITAGFRLDAKYIIHAVGPRYAYDDNPEKLLSEPYSSLMTTFEDACIDPFDTYGAELYNSYFTSLVKIGAQKHETAYFHYDTFTIYIVNDQGRLDNQIVLFDKYIKRPVHTHMLERITPVVNAYFANDRTGMINALKDNKLISSKMQKILLDQKKK